MSMFLARAKNVIQNPPRPEKCQKSQLTCQENPFSGLGDGASLLALRRARDTLLMRQRGCVLRRLILWQCCVQMSLVIQALQLKK